MPPTRPPSRVLLLGATGTIGRATLRALLAHGHAVVAFGRARAGTAPALPPGAEWRGGDLQDPASWAREALRGERFDAVVSCLASRTGAPADAWAVDHRANSLALKAAVAAGVPRFVLLSALCVQKPRLAFQHAKLAFEAELAASSLAWTVVRPTAFFKSLSGQVERVRQGRPFLVFGDGTLTACKPIADDDLGEFMARTLADPATAGRVLPVGGPGPAITPRDQAASLAALLGRPVPVKRVPVAMISTIAGALALGGLVSRRLADKAEFARTGHYYATESMLVWDAAAGRYDADATPSFGSRTLADHYAALLAGTAVHERGEHAVF